MMAVCTVQCIRLKYVLHTIFDKDPLNCQPNYIAMFSYGDSVAKNFINFCRHVEMCDCDVVLIVYILN